jgi:Fe-S cluster assembly iron-binding protein IscA
MVTDKLKSESKYALKLKDGLNGGQFNAGGEEVELTEKDPVFETSELAVFMGAKSLPFLEEVKG